ncbi:MAG: ATP-binding protein [Cyclobacteriaceae bacterium]|jgi:signal transduction histidine kinase/class 3 adenylate cyclase
MIYFISGHTISGKDIYDLSNDLSAGFQEVDTVYNYRFTRIDDGIIAISDANGVLSLDSVIRMKDLGYFKPFDWVDALAEEQEVSWVYFKLATSDTSSNNSKYLFQIGHGLQSAQRIEIYTFENGEDLLQYKKTGLALRPVEKDIRNAFNFVWLDLPHSSQIDVFIRLEGFPKNALNEMVIQHIDPGSIYDLDGFRITNNFLNPGNNLIPFPHTILNKSIEYITDQNYSIDEVKQSGLWDKNSQFNTWDYYDMKAPYWLRAKLYFDLKKPGKQLFRLENWSHADIFIYTSEGDISLIKSGISRTIKKKPVPDAQNYFYVDYVPGDTLYLHARVHSAHPSMLMNPVNAFEINHIDSDAYVSARQSNLIIIIFQGIMLAQVIFGLLVFLFLKNRSILYFTIALFGLAVFDIVNLPKATLFDVLPQLFPFVGIIGWCSGFIATIGILKLITSFLGFEEQNESFRKFVFYLLLILGIITLMSITLNFYKFELSNFLGISFSSMDTFVRYFTAIHNLYFVLTFFIIFILPLVGIIKKLKYAWILFLWVIVPAPATMLFSFENSMKILEGAVVYTLFTGAFDQSLTFYNFMQIGEFVFIVLVAAVIGLRARDMVQERQKVLEKQIENEKKVSRQLRQVDALKDQFLANTSHELKTPLQGIIGLSEGLSERIRDAADKEDLSMIIASGKRLSSLVNDILDFSKLKQHDIQLHLKTIDLHSMVNVIVRNLLPLVRGKDLDIINEINRNVPAVYADESRLNQIFYNLIGNAIKFTHEGFIKVGAHAHDDYIEVFVQDSGIGIPEEKREDIFKEFEQADGSVSRQFAGTGLGLSISKKIIELHQGEIWVKSEINAGSTFYFTLPVTQDIDRLPEPSLPDTEIIEITPSPEISEKITEDINQEETASVQGENNEPVKILVVDDEPVNQQVLKNHLSGKNYAITQALSGKDALNAIGSTPDFNLVLLDIMMPGMSGYEVCEKIREKYLSSELPIIMITAKNQLQDLVQGFSTGANDYLSKPFSKEEFLARLQTQLDLNRIFSVSDKFIPNEFLRSIGREKITEVTLGDYASKEVSILFTDIRDFTSLSETMSPEDNYKFINAFNARMGPIIRENKGFILQYLGDSIMAVFMHSSEDALIAAIGIQKNIGEFNVLRTGKGREPIKVGVGIHTGPLVMGITGDSNRMNATTIADTVNIGARLESLNKFYHTGILISETSFDQLEDEAKYHTRFLGEVVVKGKTRPVKIHECFDGDLRTRFEKKLKSQESFNQGIKKYFQKEFHDASIFFQKVLKIDKDDYTAKLFLTKSSHFIINGIPEDWTGIEKLEDK